MLDYIIAYVKLGEHEFNYQGPLLTLEDAERKVNILNSHYYIIKGERFYKAVKIDPMPDLQLVQD